MTERKACVIAAIEEAPNVTTLVLGEGDHTCQRWELSETLRKKLLLELFHIESRNWNRQAYVCVRGHSKMSALGDRSLLKCETILVSRT